VKVLLVNDYGTPTGGAENQMLDVREGLRARGHDARLFASTARDFDAPSLADYSCAGTTSRFRTLAQSANPAAGVRLRQVVRDFGPDVVHVRLFLTQLSPLILPVLRDVPAVAHVAWHRPVCPTGTKVLPDGSPCTARAGGACLRNGCLPRRDFAPLMAQRSLMRRWWSAFDDVVTLSEPLAAELEADGLGPATVLPNAVRERPARPPLADPPTVAFAGRLDRVKGVDVLLRAFDRVAAAVPDARLLIAGAGPEAGRIAALAAASPVADRIDLLGRLDRDDLDRALAAAWVQAVPSTWAEPFGNVATEAMMRGTAVVASNHGGLGRIVREGVTGYRVPPRDPVALADSLIRLLSDRDAAERMGAAGRAEAIADYGMDAYLDRLTAIYEGVRR
jgi:glycosyltransferase involved in cell wall biosynthesis